MRLMATILCCVLMVGCAHAVPVVEAREQILPRCIKKRNSVLRLL